MHAPDLLEGISHLCLHVCSAGHVYEGPASTEQHMCITPESYKGLSWALYDLYARGPDEVTEGIV